MEFETQTSLSVCIYFLIISPHLSSHQRLSIKTLTWQSIIGFISGGDSTKSESACSRSKLRHDVSRTKRTIFDPPTPQRSQGCGKASRFQVRKSPFWGNYNPERKFRAEWSIAANSGSCCSICRHKVVCVCAYTRSSTTFSFTGKSLSFSPYTHNI